MIAYNPTANLASSATYAQSSHACAAVCAALVSAHGWRAPSYGATGATLSVAAGTVSLGLDGTVVLFDRRHASGYGLVDLLLGTVDLCATPTEEATELVLSFLQ